MFFLKTIVARTIKKVVLGSAGRNISRQPCNNIRCIQNDPICPGIYCTSCVCVAREPTGDGDTNRAKTLNCFLSVAALRITSTSVVNVLLWNTSNQTTQAAAGLTTFILFLDYFCYTQSKRF